MDRNTSIHPPPWPLDSENKIQPTHISELAKPGGLGLIHSFSKQKVSAFHMSGVVSGPGAKGTVRRLKRVPGCILQ